MKERYFHFEDLNEVLSYNYLHTKLNREKNQYKEIFQIYTQIYT
jgi:hypothetical protein